MQTLSDRLPPEDGSVWLETLPASVSGDSQHLIFRPSTFLGGRFFDVKLFWSKIFDKVLVFEDLAMQMWVQASPSSKFIASDSFFRSVRCITCEKN